MVADTERSGGRGQDCRPGLAVHGTLADPDHQCAIVRPADAGKGRCECFSSLSMGDAVSDC